MHPIVALFQRNAWATGVLRDFCGEHPEADGADHDVYGSIPKTFDHIRRAEKSYFRLVTGAFPKREPDWFAVLSGMERDPEVVLEEQRGHDREWMADWVPLVQCVHHGDDHRTQVKTLLSRAGIEPPDIDDWGFENEVEPALRATNARWESLLRRTFEHHRWATSKLQDFCRDFTDEQMALSAPGTYGSLKDTFEHLVSADRLFLSRLGSHQDWTAYLDSKPDYEATVPTRRGEIASWVILVHALHHAQDHRTHIGTVLLHHKLQPPDVDVWAYATTVGALKPIPR